jgi:hypothetical protein
MAGKINLNKAWYLAADWHPVITVEIAYLKGEHGAFIEQIPTSITTRYASNAAWNLPQRLSIDLALGKQLSVRRNFFRFRYP